VVVTSPGGDERDSMEGSHREPGAVSPCLGVPLWRCFNLWKHPRPLEGAGECLAIVPDSRATVGNRILMMDPPRRWLMLIPPGSVSMRNRPRGEGLTGRGMEHPPPLSPVYHRERLFLRIAETPPPPGRSRGLLPPPPGGGRVHGDSPWIAVHGTETESRRGIRRDGGDAPPGGVSMGLAG